MLSEEKKAVQTALKKVEGLTKKVQQMVEEDAYCIDVTQQLNALVGLIKNANLRILRSHLKTCGVKRLCNGTQKQQDEFVEELVQTFSMLTKK